MMHDHRTLPPPPPPPPPPTFKLLPTPLEFVLKNPDKLCTPTPKLGVYTVIRFDLISKPNITVRIGHLIAIVLTCGVREHFAILSIIILYMSSFNTSELNCSNESYIEALVLETSLAASGILVCSVVIILAATLQLHKQFLYRLIIYQVSSFLAFGATNMLDIVQQLIMTRNQSQVYLPLCLAAAFLYTYTLLVKLFFTLIISVHLFCFAVCFKNLKNFEICYILTALVVPAIMAAVPFATSTYGQQGQGQPWCWIQLHG